MTEKQLMLIECKELIKRELKAQNDRIKAIEEEIDDMLERLGER